MTIYLLTDMKVTIPIGKYQVECDNLMFLLQKIENMKFDLTSENNVTKRL
jgi:hypothetical protein